MTWGRYYFTHGNLAITWSLSFSFCGALLNGAVDAIDSIIRIYLKERGSSNVASRCASAKHGIADVAVLLLAAVGQSVSQREVHHGTSCSSCHLFPE